MESTTLAPAMATWAKLASALNRPTDRTVSLDPLRRMIGALDRDAKVAAERLHGLFAETDNRYPGIGDPLNARLDIGSHRWLGQEHENSYSDWLAWIIERQDDPTHVLPLFGTTSPPDVHGEWTVEREVVKPYGRLDLLLRNPKVGVLCVEVKTDSIPGEDQLERYLKWLEGQRPQLGLVLLAIDQPENDPQSGKYHFCSWKHVSLTLRTWASAWLRDSSRFYAAVMTLAFCGAIERNLLSLDSSGLNAVRTADYLEEVLAMPEEPDDEQEEEDSELLREGCRSYHKALFALIQFRREAQDVIQRAIDRRIDRLAESMQLEKANLIGLPSYLNPNFGVGWDGSEAAVGVKYPPEEIRWAIYFYVRIAEGKGTSVCASFWRGKPGIGADGLARLNKAGLETKATGVWLSERIDETTGGFKGAVGRTLDRWIEAWREAGGIRQFLPPS